MCRTVIARTFAAVALAAFLAGAPSAARAQALSQLFVEALDARTGAPVMDLRPTDFRVEEDGSPGGVVSADVGDAPMKIALLVDNGDVLADMNAISDLRGALDDFLDTLAPTHEVGLFTIARQTRRRVDFTLDRVELKSGVGEIFPDRGGSVRVFDGVRDTLNRRFEDEEPFPVFVLVLTDGSEGSGYVTPGEFAELGRLLVNNAVTIHTVLMSMRGGSAVTSISSNLSQNTGGVFEVINASSGLDEELTELATRMNAHYDRVSNWYRLIYERPNPPGSRVSVRLTSRPGVRFNLFIDRRMQP